MRALTAIICALALAVIIFADANSIDCNDPNTWATASGVQHCAINGGK